MTPAEALKTAMGLPTAQMHEDGWGVDDMNYLVVPCDNDPGINQECIVVVIQHDPQP